LRQTAPAATLVTIPTVVCVKLTNVTFINNFPPDVRYVKRRRLIATAVKALMDLLA
jgi:hypothetical protein